MKIRLYILFIMLLGLSCNREQRQLEHLVEETLPGEWNIVSLEVKGIYKSDATDYGFSSDTILYNVGTMTFPEFNIDTLALNGGGHGVGIECIITDGAHKESFRIERLFCSADKTWAYFRVNENELFNEEYELVKLINFTSLFWQNMFLSLENKNLINFTTTDGTRISLTLERK